MSEQLLSRREMLGVIAFFASPLTASSACDRCVTHDHASSHSTFVRVPIEIIVNGRPLPITASSGFSDASVIVPRYGVEYSILIANPLNERVEVVVEVDGLSVMTGRPAMGNQRGYLIDPRQRLRINGWRRNDRETAAFFFSAPQDSLAMKQRYSARLGTIHVAMFAQHVPIPVAAYRDAAPGAHSLGHAIVGTAAGHAIAGTAAGRVISSPVQRVSFERGKLIASQLVRYATPHYLHPPLTWKESR